jgi:hypothetical protein
MKKFIGLLLGIMLTLALVGCGESKKTTAKQTTTVVDKSGAKRGVTTTGAKTTTQVKTTTKEEDNFKQIYSLYVNDTMIVNWREPITANFKDKDDKEITLTYFDIYFDKSNIDPETNKVKECYLYYYNYYYDYTTKTLKTIITKHICSATTDTTIMSNVIVKDIIYLNTTTTSVESIKQYSVNDKIEVTYFEDE